MWRTKSKHFEQFDNDKNFCFTAENFFSENKNFSEQNKNLLVEIWPWNWKFFSNLVKNNQDLFCVWCDLRKDRLITTWDKTEKLLRKDVDLSRLDNKNFSFVFWDAKDFIETCEDESIEKIYMNFPDACPEKKRWRNRFFQPETIELVFKKLKKWWKIFIKTDDYDYFSFTRISFFFKKKLFSEIYHSKDVYKDQDVESENYICTEFEERWISEWKTIFELHYEKK